ncbi:MAG: DUF2442 domain-containing protein [Bacteroidia bacterium]|nr:DUF2442 domain-containing protein [Bacteroidia bacterium]MCF8426530.1 DUF2442 domain-containing protein [Bacteroidia bacterium]
MLPKLRQVISNIDYTLSCVFEDGSHKVFDVKPYLDKGDFVELKDIQLFKTAHVFMGTVQWSNELDIAPETLFLESKELVV